MVAGRTDLATVEHRRGGADRRVAVVRSTATRVSTCASLTSHATTEKAFARRRRASLGANWRDVPGAGPIAEPAVSGNVRFQPSIQRSPRAAPVAAISTPSVRRMCGGADRSQSDQRALTPQSPQNEEERLAKLRLPARMAPVSGCNLRRRASARCTGFVPAAASSPTIRSSLHPHRCRSTASSCAHTGERQKASRSASPAN